jgi:hypothetical protein
VYKKDRTSSNGQAAIILQWLCSVRPLEVPAVGGGHSFQSGGVSHQVTVTCCCGDGFVYGACCLLVLFCAVNKLAIV